MQSTSISDTLITPGTLGIRMPSLVQPIFKASEQASRETEPGSESLGWNANLIEALTLLQRAVNESFVFGALTGPKKCGKSAVARALISTSKIQKRICVNFQTPNLVTTETNSKFYKALQKAIDLDQNGCRLLFVVDNAHVSSEAIMFMLCSIAGAYSRFSGAQVILVGEPELWELLALPQYDKLLRRFALRCKIRA